MTGAACFCRVAAASCGALAASVPGCTMAASDAGLAAVAAAPEPRSPVLLCASAPEPSGRKKIGSKLGHNPQNNPVDVELDHRTSCLMLSLRLLPVSDWSTQSCSMMRWSVLSLDVL